MPYDIARIRRVMKQIEAEPETLYMPTYARRVHGCGTTLCLAGHLCVDEGLKLHWMEDEIEGYAEACGLADGRSIHDAAAQLAGFDSYEANQIFLATGAESAAELWDVIESATHGAVTEYDQD
jgi:hypothetical protein